MLDFSQRAHLTELMDAPCSYEDLHACLIDLAEVNRVTLAHRPTLQWLSSLSKSFCGRQVHIVDVGCGGGDMLRHIERWARREGLQVQLTGVDLNPFAIRTAHSFAPGGSNIRWITGDAYSLDIAEGPIDLIISSLFTHHLEDDEIIRFLQWMETTAQYGWFISDLARGKKSYYIFKVLAAAFGWHKFVCHDGPVSIRRAFQRDDWQRYLMAANIRSAFITPQWPGRLCVARKKLT